jgi:hypothetical protein
MNPIWLLHELGVGAWCPKAELGASCEYDSSTWMNMFMNDISYG